MYSSRWCVTRNQRETKPRDARSEGVRPQSRARLIFETLLVGLNGLLVIESELSPVCSLLNMFSYNFF